jgi:hypothetical protein
MKCDKCGLEIEDVSYYDVSDWNKKHQKAWCMECIKMRLGERYL